MNMQKMIAAAMLAMPFMVATADAAVTFTMAHRGANKNVAGNITPVSQGTVITVIDLNNDGWLGNSYTAAPSGGRVNANSWLWDPNDVIIGRFAFGGTNPQSASTNGTNVDGLANYTPGVDRWYTIWFDVPFSSGALGPGANVSYFVKDNGFVPATGGSATGSITSTVGPMNLTTVIPEPTSALLLLAGSGLLIARRRQA